MKHTRWVASIIGYVKWGFMLGLSLIGAKTAFNLSMTGVQKYIIDEVFMEQRYDLLWPVLFVFLASVLLYNGCHIIGEMILNISSRKANIWLLDKYMQSVHKLHSGILKKERIGRLTQYYTQEINSVTNILGPGGLFSDGLQKLLSLIILAVIVGLNSPLILLVLLAIGIVYIPLGKHYKTILRGAAKQTQERMADIGVQISEGISSTREVVAFNRMNWEKGILQGLFDRYFHASMKELGLANKQAYLSESMRLGTAFFVLAYGGFEVVRGSLSLGLFIIIFQFSNQLMTSIGGLYQCVMQIPSTLASIDRLRGVMEGDQRLDGTVTLDEPIRTIEFRNVNFRYEADSNPVLRNFTMRWNGYGKMAVVGTSGSGKSTIAQLLVRFYDPDAGTILVNGLPLDRITFASWSDKTTIIFQDPYLFPDTIHNNLKMDLEACTEEELIAACKMACIHEEILKLPDGYHTSLGERGVTLSGGQRQRLAIARALLRNPEVLILDEATSALDLETERKVMNHLDTLRKDRLTIVIAHRLSTVINAEQIYVVDRGQLSEYGTHQELLHRGAKYAELQQLAHTG